MAWLTSRMELGQGGAAGHVRAMEGLRGFAVFLVFLVHYASLAGPWLAGNASGARALDFVHTVGNAGVDIFFALSGYLIYGSLIAAPMPFGRYIARRVRRIYPVFLVVLAIYVGLSFAAPATSRIPPDAADAALYLSQNLLLLPGILPIEPLITVAWSLSYEMLFYLTLPLLIALLRLRERTQAWRFGCFATLAALVLIGFATTGSGPVRLVMFTAGILAYEAVGRRGSWLPPSTAAFVALGAGLLALTVPQPGPAAYALKLAALFIGIFVLCVACFGRPESSVARCFSWTPMRWLGNMSYSYYLLHGLALKAVFLAIGIAFVPLHPILWTVTMLAPIFLATLLPAGLMFLLVERPVSLRPARRHA